MFGQQRPETFLARLDLLEGYIGVEIEGREPDKQRTDRCEYQQFRFYVSR